MRKWAALSILLPVISGCSYTKPLIVAPMQLGPKEYPKAVGIGRSSAQYLFGFRISGDDSMAEAIKDLRSKTKVPKSTMANVFVDRHLFYFPTWWLPIYADFETTIFGTLVTYEPEKEPPK